MSAEVKHLNASDFSDDQLNRLAFALVGKLNKCMVVVRPLKGKAAIEFSGFGKTKFYEMVKLGYIEQFGDESGDPIYLPDQIVEGIRKYQRHRKS